MKTYVYQHEDKVRDYECDLQGVVNNANYLHYMEHTRHEFLLSLGENFITWLESIGGFGTDICGNARNTGAMWPGAYQKD